MGKLKTFLKKLFFLPPLAILLIALPCFVLTFYLLFIEADGVLTYGVYALSAYSLIITITGFGRIVRWGKRGISESAPAKKILLSPMGNRYITDPFFRTKLSLSSGLILNLAYILIKMVSGIYYRSLWLIALAVYYILLAFLRFFLLASAAKHGFGKNIPLELRRYRTVGIIFLLMNQALTVIVLLIVRQGQGFVYPGVLIYAMAFYAFYTVTVAVINLVKARKQGSPILSAVKAVNLVTALVSLLALTTAMLTSFGDGDTAFQTAMTGAVGGGVCATVICIAIFMIVKATKKIKASPPLPR